MEQLHGGQARAAAERELLAAARLGLRVVGLDEPDYPAHLARVFDPPPVLYVRGRLVGDEGRAQPWPWSARGPPRLRARPWRGGWGRSWRRPA